MRKIYRKKDKYGGYLEVQLLDRNNENPDDVIWLHLKNKEEQGFVMTKLEALLIVEGLIKAVNELNIMEHETKNPR